ncbi:hypothetical protein F0U60_51105 [Archangium minus]|uniref:Uncharacterized protein n=1 Tax=Archangium minus TaxID=83450 RepID=A0ABY9X843_9BACT|nr:hypothetical protein F0U60_51105 [Archangium minus]
MLIPTLFPKLDAEIERLFMHPAHYGLPKPLQEEGLALHDVLEALLLSPKWEWLTPDDLSFALDKSARFRLMAERVVPVAPLVATSDKTGQLADDSTAQKLPIEVFLAGSSGGSTLREPNTLQSRLYEQLEKAVIVAGARTGSFENIHIRRLRTEPAVARGARLRVLGNGLLSGTGIEDSMLEDVSIDLNAPWMDAVRYRLKLGETLYLDEPSLQADAARALFQLRTQLVVEADLVSHLAEDDRYVRINVLSALGLPAYKVGFVPGEPLPPRDERLEPVTLQPTTVRAILSMARNELDPGVLSYVVCTLKSQTYHGKLHEVSADVREVIRRTVLPRVEESSVVQDCKELLRLLPPIQ